MALMRASAPSRASLSMPKMSTMPLLSTSVMVMVVLVVFWMSWITFPPGPITGPIISCGMTICTMRGTQGL